MNQRPFNESDGDLIEFGVKAVFGAVSVMFTLFTALYIIGIVLSLGLVGLLGYFIYTLI